MCKISMKPGNIKYDVKYEYMKHDDENMRHENKKHDSYDENIYTKKNVSSFVLLYYIIMSQFISGQHLHYKIF